MVLELDTLVANTSTSHYISPHILDLSLLGSWSKFRCYVCGVAAKKLYLVFGLEIYLFIAASLHWTYVCRLRFYGNMLRGGGYSGLLLV